MKLYKTLASALAAATIGISAPVLAHPRLVAATPAQSASVNHVDRIVLTFSEPLTAAFSGFDVVMTAMPGMAPGHQHQPLKVGGIIVRVGPDGKSLVGTLARRLPQGSYDVNWRAVSTDTHRITGKISFTVR
ncbi:copper homeostasis periplasmic binding protein CopC [Sphingopyxis sp. GW247-27LB]|uniref:copper homeostasis periplasmic binding protein CopC n=1 Tax=Sphingopyxis sp. GW247-27LB TaxID=2012632 RepID=UPI000BA6A822|nr:copper homeostasis periplasmic binding protein CopC [Sphingopyxis sp. GW247-27LB]PAL19776.1 copper resistance protein CopC [Sphingopyxis sp. GW247-27LB]